MATDIAASLPLNRILPPLQTNFAGHGFGNDVTDSRHFKAESVERKKMMPLGRIGEQAGQPSILVLLADEVFAKGIMGFQQVRHSGSGHSDQSGGNKAFFVQQNIIGASSGPRRHRFRTDANRAQPVFQNPWDGQKKLARAY